MVKDFILQDLPGSGKRIDILCRVLSACFDWGPSTWKKNKIEVIAVIGNSIILRFQNPGESLPSGERAWAEIIKESLKGSPSDFVHAYEGDLESIIIEVNSVPNSTLWVLHEEGESMNLQEIQISGTDNSFMLGDHRGFNSQIEELISKHTLRKISLGKTSYLSSHCAAHIISEIERG
jgi:tRNA (pseudouridine54-N1)-methyltransferase